MTKFENKKTKIKAENGFMSYTDLIKECIKFVPKELSSGGWTPALQRDSFRVEDALSGSKPSKTIEIEDHDIILIKNFCADFPWAIRDRSLVEFDEYIKQL